MQETDAKEIQEQAWLGGKDYLPEIVQEANV